MNENELTAFLKRVGKRNLTEYLNPFAETREVALQRRFRWAKINQYDYANKTEARFLLAHREALLAFVRRRDHDDPLLERVSKEVVSAAPDVLRSFMRPPRSQLRRPPRQSDMPRAPRPVPVASIANRDNVGYTPEPVARQPVPRRRKRRIPRPAKPCETCSSCRADIRKKVAYLTPAMDDWLCRACAAPVAPS